MAPNAPHHPQKLVGSRWTAVEVKQKRKHWEVMELCADGQEAILTAVIDGHRVQIGWRELRERQSWLPGWQ